MRSGPKRGSGERSNIYSRSKFTNWTPFDPFSSEADAVLKTRLAPEIHLEAVELSIYASPLSPGFLRPCSPEQVAEVLREVPQEFLRGLRGLYLLGGSARQARAARGALRRFGCYYRDRIFLYAFPQELLHFETRRPPKPSVVQEYERAGAVIERRGNHCSIVFDADSLRRFYLYDVLLHEVGHHVDGRIFSRPSRDAERYAEWFVREQARRRRGGGAA